jgi:hypothetical protein
MSTACQVAAYYFPGFHPNPFNNRLHGQNWTEWELLRRAEPRFPGHRQPLVPAWGYQDESDPQVFAGKIAAAADHGLDAFIFDWYWYAGKPAMEGALEGGYLGAANRERVRFALMWANHDWCDGQPAKLDQRPALVAPGALDAAHFRLLGAYVIERYFRQPSYWCITGRPYFSIYDVSLFCAGLGGVAAARTALDAFRAQVRAAGFPDLHLNLVVAGVRILPTETALMDPAAIVSALGADSVTSYVLVHHVELSAFPVTPYAQAQTAMATYWREAASTFAQPYHPNVTMGWDASPRCCQSDRFENRGYPFMATLGGNTPEAFRVTLATARETLATRPVAERVLTINAWNEWTEGSYLEPDTLHGMAYLEALRAVFT